jgi:integrase
MRLYYVSKPIKSTNEVYVVLKYKFKSEQIDLSPKIKCLLKDWGDGKSSNPIKKSDSDHIRKNAVLRLFKEDVEKIRSDFELKGVLPTCQLVRDEFKLFREERFFEKEIEITKDRFPVLYVIKKYLDNVEDLEVSRIQNGDVLYKSHTKSVKFRMNIVSEFILKNYGKDFGFYEVNEDFFKKYQVHLIDKEYQNTTISKIISQFRQFLNWSKVNNYVTDVYKDFRNTLSVNHREPITLKEEYVYKLFDWRKFDYSSGISGDNEQPIYMKYYSDWNFGTYLVNDELRSVEKDKEGKPVRNKKGVIENDIPTGRYNTYTTYEVIKDMFVFGISTGLRYSDLVKIKVGDFDFSSKKFKLIQKKTSRVVEIVENEMSREIFMKYSSNKSLFQYLFPLPCKTNDKSRSQYNTKSNRHLKNIGSILEFNELVEVVTMSGRNYQRVKVPIHNVMSFHMSRRTHGTIGIKQGVDPISMMGQMGHQDPLMTSKYVKKNEESLRGMFGKRDKKEEEIKVRTDGQYKEDSSLESKLDRLKSMRDKGVLPLEVYLQHVEKLLKEYGL